MNTGIGCGWPEDQPLPQRKRLPAWPETIIIRRAPIGPKWRFEIRDGNDTMLDYSLASSRWLVWRMAKSSWRRLTRAAAKERAQRR